MTNEASKRLEQGFAREDAERRALDWKAVLSTREGRRLLTHIVERSGIFLVHLSEEGLALAAGRRNLGLELRMEAMAASPEGVALAEAEAVETARDRARRRVDAAEEDRRARADTIWGRLTGPKEKPDNAN